MDGICSPRMQGVLALMFDNDCFHANADVRFGDYRAREAKFMLNIPMSKKF